MISCCLTRGNPAPTVFLISPRIYAHGKTLTDLQITYAIIDPICVIN